MTSERNGIVSLRDHEDQRWIDHEKVHQRENEARKIALQAAKAQIAAVVTTVGLILTLVLLVRGLGG